MIRRDDVFVLAAGESRVLGRTGGPIYLPEPGRYRVQFYYENIPGLPSQGIPGNESGAEIRDRMQKSEPCRPRSNELIVEVKSARL